MADNNKKNTPPEGMNSVEVVRNEVKLVAEPTAFQKAQAGKWYLAPTEEHIKANLSEYFKFFGEDYMWRRIVNLIRAPFKAAFVEATTKEENNQTVPKPFDASEFIESVVSLTSRGEKMEDLEADLNELLAEFVEVGSQVQEALDAQDFTTAAKFSAVMKEKNNEIKSVKAAIDKKKRPRKTDDEKAVEISKN